MLISELRLKNMFLFLGEKKKHIEDKNLKNILF